MIYKVTVSDEAKGDLKGIYEYIAFNLSAPINAAGQLERIENHIINLNELPKRFPLYPNEPWHSLGMRYMVIDNYIVFYITDDDSKIVSVLRVFYGSRDIDKIFENMQ